MVKYTKWFVVDEITKAYNISSNSMHNWKLEVLGYEIPEVKSVDDGKLILGGKKDGKGNKVQ